MTKKIISITVGSAFLLVGGAALAQNTTYQEPTNNVVTTSHDTVTKAMYQKSNKRIATQSYMLRKQKRELRRVSSKTGSLESQIKSLRGELKYLEKKQNEMSKNQNEANVTMQKRLHRVSSSYSHGLPVVSSPFLGARDGYSVYNLVVNLPSVNQDLYILRQRQKLANEALKNHEALPDRPLIDLSGSVEGQMLYKNNYQGPSTTDINLSGAQLDVLGEISPWATAAAFFSYESSPPITGARIENSRIKLSHGFLTIGNLNKAPVYFSIGQLYVPFGVYSYYMVTSPLTKSLARVKTRAAVLGLSLPNGFYASTYTFHGDSYVSNGGIINNWGLNAGFGSTVQQFSFDFGAGYISNMADANGMQYTGAQTGFTGFSSFSNGDYIFGGHEKLQHYVPGADIHVKLGYNPFSPSLNFTPFKFVAEYVTALRSFDPADLTFNGSGARPAAFDLEGAYNFQVMGKNSSLSAGFGLTREALGFNLPQQSYYAALSANIWRYTIESIELRHDRNYNATDAFSGAGLDSMNPIGKRDRNLVTAQIGVYF